MRELSWSTQTENSFPHEPNHARARPELAHATKSDRISSPVLDPLLLDASCSHTVLMLTLFVLL